MTLLRLEPRSNTGVTSKRLSRVFYFRFCQADNAPGPCGPWAERVRGEWTYPSNAGTRNRWSARLGNANRWSWPWWKAKRKAGCGASTWNAITIWDATCHLARTCAIRCGVAIESLPACLWTSPAWKMQARDAWIGWSDEERQRKLQGIVNNGRFLILPWVRVKGLASKILALSTRQLPHDWQTRYGHSPLRSFGGSIT